MASRRRRFSTKQRFALCAGAQDRCEECGAPLLAGFHADHVLPYAHGGLTDVANGQALCPTCNLRKGAKLKDTRNGRSPFAPQSAETAPMAPRVSEITPTASSLSLRPWQRHGLDVWQEIRRQGRRDMMVMACPGAGKTALALQIIRLEKARHRCSLAVIVVPSRQLKRQWAKAAQRAGVTLTAGWGNGAVGPAEGVDGVVITYSQLARLPEAVRLLCRRHHVLAILDEVHHGGEGRAWGDGLREGLEDAQARLCLSGTPFRSDHLSLPFIRYDALGRVVSDVAYPLIAALADKVIRPAFFHVCHGAFEWRDAVGLHHATFKTCLGETGQTRRLRVALAPEGNFLPAVLRQADTALRDVRLTHARAKGFVVCRDARHARAVAHRLTEMTGVKPALVLSDNPEAADALEQFRRDGSAWLVVCRMAGEGFDCPDLRVCVWATPVMSELFFRQVVGRVLRKVDGLPYQDATVFLPADPRLTAMARAFLKEPTCSQDLNSQQETKDWGKSAPKEAPEIGFAMLSSEAAGVEVLAGNSVITERGLRFAQIIKDARPRMAFLPAHYVAAHLAGIVTGGRPDTHQHPEWTRTGVSLPGDPAARKRRAEEGSGTGVAASQEASHAVKSYPEAETYDETVHRLRRDCTRLTRQIARELDVPVKNVYQFYRGHLGYGQTEATLEQLRVKRDILRRKVHELGTVPK